MSGEATTFLLIRHARHDWVGKGLASRLPGVHLNAQGLREAEELADRLAGRGIDAIYASPRERAQETAAPLARRLGQPVRLSVGSDDIDFGEWSGRSFVEMAESEPQWPVWVNQRSAAQPPGGETITRVQRRFMEELTTLARAHRGEIVALFAHCDVIKVAIAHVLECSLDRLEQFEIAPASVSVVVMGADWAKVQSLNLVAADLGRL